MTRDARRGTKYPADEPTHPVSRGTMRRWVIGMLFALIALLHLAGTPAAPADQWVSLGPADTQVAAIAIDPTTPTTLYAGTDGGVFKSTDRGGSWEVKLSIGSVAALVVDPTTPTTLYAGVGNAVYKSTSGGETWYPTGSLNFKFAGVYTLALDPTTPTTIYAGGYCDCGEIAFIGFSKSTDGGATWQAGGVSTPRPTAPAQRPLWLRPEWAFAILRACGKAPPPRHDMCRHRTVSTTSSGPDRAERASKPPRGVPVAKRAC